MTFRFALATSLALGIVFLTASCSLFGGGGGCGSYRTDKVVRIGSHKFDAQVVSSESGLEGGLGDRKCIGSNQGMLFAFKEPGIYAFWMKGMKFPIDIIWLGEDRSVVWLEKNVSPSSYPTNFFNRESPAKYVLEVKAGTANKLGLKLGSQVSF